MMGPWPSEPEAVEARKSVWPNQASRIDIGSEVFGRSHKTIYIMTEADWNASGHSHTCRDSLYQPERPCPLQEAVQNPVSAEERARMVQPQDCADLIRYIALLPKRLVMNEVMLGPTWNRAYECGQSEESFSIAAKPARDTASRPARAAQAAPGACAWLRVRR